MTTEEISDIRAVTYNLENGKVVETKLEKSALFKEQLDRNHIKAKFTLPNVKEGSIFEYEYKVTSPYLFNLTAWEFQGTAPRLWSEYQLSLPQFLNYVVLSQGYQPLYKKEQKSRSGLFNVREEGAGMRTETTNITCTVNDNKWIMKDVPGLKPERYTSTLKNHISRIEFQLSGYQDPIVPRRIMSTWPEAMKSLLEDENFGKLINAGNGWMHDLLKEIVGSATTHREKAKRIYTYVRDHYVCVDHHAVMTENTLRTVVKNKKGSVSEINLLLTALLKEASIPADPVLLSTKDYGYPPDFYPLMNRFNYVICRALVEDKTYLLDASHPRLGFGCLPAECYNGAARVANEQAEPVLLPSDSLKESKISSIAIFNDDKGKWVGSMNQNSGYYESYDLREKIKDKGQEEFFREVKKAFGSDITIEQPRIDSLENYETPVHIAYTFRINNEDADILYINPMFGEGYKQNPFKSAERFYPVEMPYTTDETYNLTLEVPKGYKVDELPKSIKVKLNEQGEGYFEYLISQSGNLISMRSRLRISRSFFQPEEYDLLREFYNLIVNKHNEQIVFKKSN